MSIDARVGSAKAPARPAAVRWDRRAADDFDAALSVGTRPRAGWEASYLRRVVLLDGVVALLAGLLGYSLRFADPSHHTELTYLGFTACLPALWTALLAVNKAYQPRYLYGGTEETRRIFRSGLMLVAGISFIAYALRQDFSRGYVLCAFPLLVLTTAVMRYAVRKVLHRRRAAGACMERTIVVGHAEPAGDMIRRLRRQHHHGLDVVGVCLPPGVEPGSDDASSGVPVSSLADISEAVRLQQAHAVVVLSCPEMDGEQLRRLSWRLEGSGAQLLVAPALVDVTGPRTSVRLAAGLPLLHVEPPEFSGLRRLVKSTLDKTAATLGLLLLSPLLITVAALIALEDGHSPIFRQRRVGRHGKEFVLYKFRSMYVDAEVRLAALQDENESDGVLFKMREDPRITRIGRRLRRLSIDELPQLVNVLKGEMSLVGPRPPLPAEVSSYESDFRRRLVVPPGLTGLWQVSGRSDLSWEESMYLDLHYVENWSPVLDFMILLKTTRAVVSGSGAY